MAFVFIDVSFIRLYSLDMFTLYDINVSFNSNIHTFCCFEHEYVSVVWTVVESSVSHRWNITFS